MDSSLGIPALLKNFVFILWMVCPFLFSQTLKPSSHLISSHLDLCRFLFSSSSFLAPANIPYILASSDSHLKKNLLYFYQTLLTYEIGTYQDIYSSALWLKIKVSFVF